MLKSLLFPTQQFKKISDNTPIDRDRYVDFLRAFSILVVVFGHWLSAVVFYKNGQLTAHNIVGIVPGLWITTWILQPMPLFFFVGGFSNYVSYQSIKKNKKSIREFYRARTSRLLKPTIVFILAWLLVLIILYFIQKERGTFLSSVTSKLPLFGPLWFLIVYILIVLTTPVMQLLHKKYRMKVVYCLFGLAVIVDLVRFLLSNSYFSYLNILFVWLLVHQLGFFYADGSLTRFSKLTFIISALVSLIVLTILTNIGIYPRSMVGTGVEKVSNMSPPTICILIFSFWLISLAMLFRDQINRWLAQAKNWLSVVIANSVIMTVYLWHLTAYAITFLLFYPIGLGRNTAGSLWWWLERPLWVLSSIIFLLILLVIFAQFELGTRLTRKMAASKI